MGEGTGTDAHAEKREKDNSQRKPYNIDSGLQRGKTTP